MADEIEFRRATRDDIPTIVAMLADDPLGKEREDTTSPLNKRYLNAFEAIDSDQNQLLAVAVNNGEIVGTLQLTFMPSLSRTGAWRGQIEGVRIDSSYRGAGLGQKMFEWAIDRCRDRKCDLVQLTTDKTRPDAHRFYDKLGFKSSHIGYKMLLT